MRTAEQEFAALRRRYVRMLKFDRVLFAIYGLTAIIPIYAIFAREGDRMFHAVGALLVVLIGAAGVYVDTRILRGKLRKEWFAYAVTAGVILSRFALGVWAIGITYPRIMDDVMREVFGSSAASTQITLSESISRALGVFLEPAIIWVLFPVAFYRVLYHISVHFLMRIQKMDTEPNQPVNPTSGTRPAIEKSVVFSSSPASVDHG